jgi:hypothetical protein
MQSRSTALLDIPGDLDLWVGPDADNVARMLEAVKEFGFPFADFSPEDLIREQAE